MLHRFAIVPLAFVLAACGSKTALRVADASADSADEAILDVPRGETTAPIDVPSVPDVPVLPDVPALPDVPMVPQRCTTTVATTLPPRLDLLLLVDNSNSMRDNQAHLMGQFDGLMNALLHPPCISLANPAQHTCDPTDPRDVFAYQAVTDLHVGVVSQDLGTAGSQVPGCAISDRGDNGLLNPIRSGPALQHHEPAQTAPPTFPRPTDCTDPNQFPAFITFASGVTDPTQFVHDFKCNAGLYVGGCGLEQQLEAVYDALITHDASDAPGNTNPNAGFLRADALLAMLLVTDEEDGSIRDCRFAERGVPCSDALDVFNSGSSQWSSQNLNLRDYLYQPGSTQDPTWALERYVDPSNPARGFLSLKPGHPERVVFAAITGVPLDIPRIAATGQVNWDSLLGAPGANPDDFLARNTRTAYTRMSAEGPVSMQQAHVDPNCPDRTVPACRREGSAFNPNACTTDVQYFAWPARRIVEVARRFDTMNLCHGPCRNGVIASICANDYSTAMSGIVHTILTRLTCE